MKQSMGDLSSFFALPILSAVLTLALFAGSISWLTHGLASDVGALLVTWLIVTLVLRFAFAALSRRLGAWLTAFPVKRIPSLAEEQPDAMHDAPPARLVRQEGRVDGRQEESE
jgi:hypothetical protein